LWQYGSISSQCEVRDKPQGNNKNGKVIPEEEENDHLILCITPLNEYSDQLNYYYYFRNARHIIISYTNYSTVLEKLIVTLLVKKLRLTN
jgi:hypothetical protein